MCDIHRQFILCSCQFTKKERKDPNALTWTLSRHHGYHTLSIDGIMAFPCEEITADLKSMWVESHLNSQHCFDFDYSPSELDELCIRLGYEMLENPKFLSFVFENGRWHRDQMHRFEDISEQFHEGRLVFGEENRLNSIRTHRLARLAEAEATEDALCFLLARLLREFEAFEAEVLEREWEEMLPLIMESAVEATRKWLEPDEIVRARLLAELKDILQTPKLLPSVPMRRSMGAIEAGELWEQFQVRLGKSGRRFVFDETEIDVWKAQMAGREVKLYNLCPFALDRNCALSSHWVSSMLQGDDSYWVACDFKWALYAEGNGYFEVLGDLGG